MFAETKRVLLSIKSASTVKHDPFNVEAMRTIGTKVVIEWRKDDQLRDWKPGWYTATVRLYNIQTDMITVEYVSETGTEYTLPIQKSVTEGRLKVARKDTANCELYDQVTEIGAKILVKWDSKDVKESGWRAGWYLAEVQGFDPEDDTIDIIYSKEPDVTYTEDVSAAISTGSIRISKAVF